MYVYVYVCVCVCVRVCVHTEHFFIQKIKMKEKITDHFHSLCCISFLKKFIFKILLATLCLYHFVLNSLICLMTLCCKYLITSLFSS